MSDQDEQVMDVVQNAAEGIEQFEEVDDHPTRTPVWFAPAWFLLGIVVGIVGFAAYTTLTVKPTAASAPVFDAVAMRGAARDGVIEAIATLQAGGGQQQPAAESQGPAVADPSQFTLREANVLGQQTASITIIEFSDFQ